jgi:hypothetical protein
MLDFLKGIKLEEAPLEPQRKVVAAKDRKPADDFMGIRIWKNGEIYPSVALAAQLNLEYVPVTITMVPVLKDGEPVMIIAEDGTQTPKMKRKYDYPDSVGNALDVIDTAVWSQYPKDGKRLLLVGLAGKLAPKVDLFGSTKYSDDGQPVTSVLTQGASTFGKDSLLPSLKEVYAVEPNEEGFIDLVVAIDSDLATLSSSGIFVIPKQVTRGDDAGKADYEIRENTHIYPLVPVSLMPGNAPEVSDAQPTAQG